MNRNRIDPSVTDALDSLRREYLGRLTAELDALEQIARSITFDDDIKEQLMELHTRLHKLAGSGGTFGLTALSTQARKAEQTARELMDVAPELLSHERRGAFADDIEQLRSTILLSEPVLDVSDTEMEEHYNEGRHTLIWVVEDDVLLGEELTLLLAQFGYEAILFTRFAEAEAAAEKQRPDMIILDVLFPEEGLNAASALHAGSPLRSLGCPILFISAHDDFHSRIEAARFGASAYLLKPLDVPRLVDRLESVIALRNAEPYRVLVVDDDDLLAEHYRLTLTAAGMLVTVLQQPDRIMETLAAFRPELVLMDLNMPEFSGAELAGVIRQHDEWVGLPIVYLSAEADLDEQIKAMSQGTDDFLTKPISDAHLIAAVQVRAARSRQLNDLMARDSLTGLYKHARIKEELDIETARSRRNGTSFSVAMVDIDHFKSINDTYGHVTGDRVIKALAHLLKQRLRITDSIGRYGGEEFLVILPDSSASEAKELMEDIRHRFGSLCFRHDGREFAVTFSAGVAGADVFIDADQLLEAADSALYAAKHRGRNQVVLNLQDNGILTGGCI